LGEIANFNLKNENEKLKKKIFIFDFEVEEISQNGYPFL
jgi:hypothetical protein